MCAGICVAPSCGAFELKTPALPPLASPDDKRKGAGSRFPPDALRWRGGRG